MNTLSEITSCITLSSIKEKGPPLPENPMRFAGTWKQYSKKAIPQLTSIIRNRGRAFMPFIALNLR